MNGGSMYRISPEGRLNPRGAPPNNTNTNTYRNRRDGDQTVVGGGEIEQHRVFVCFGNGLNSVEARVPLIYGAHTPLIRQSRSPRALQRSLGAHCVSTRSRGDARAAGNGAEMAPGAYSSEQHLPPLHSGLCRSVPVSAGLCRSVPVSAGLCRSVRWAGFALGDSGELVLASKDACSPSNCPSCFSCFLSRWSLHSTNKVNQQ
jgi:hypothetical protein